MQIYTKRGVPKSLTDDGWWFASPPDQRGSSASSSIALTAPWIGILALLLVLDFTMWGGGFGALPFAILTLGMVAILAVVFQTTPKRLIWIGAAAVLSVLPLISFVQTLSVLWWLVGLVVILALFADVPVARLWSFVWRIPWAGIMPLKNHLSRPSLDAGAIQRFLQNWMLAMVIGIVFLILFFMANPITETLIEIVFKPLEEIDISFTRMLFWIYMFGLSGVLISTRFIKIPTVKTVTYIPKLSNAALVRALVAFNLIFALQLLSDAVVLIGNSGLPDGVSFADYVHRGAYPLVVTSMLAAVFLIIVRRQGNPSDLMRWLMLAWVAQNVILLGFAGFRLLQYIDHLGLTYLRLHAVIWMALVALAMGLIAWDTWTKRAVGVAVRWTACATLGVVYIACFINFGAIITTYNIDRGAQGHKIDWRYLCTIGPTNHAVLFERPEAWKKPKLFNALEHHEISGWREWDYRRMTIDRRIQAVTNLSEIDSEKYYGCYNIF